MSKARLSITPAKAWSDQRLTPLQRCVLGLIGSYLNEDMNAWPSQTTLAKQLGVSRETVNRAIRSLIDYGYVVATPRKRQDGGKSVNVYHVPIDPKRAQDVGTHVTPGSQGACDALITPPVTPESHTHVTEGSHTPCDARITCDGGITGACDASVTTHVTQLDHNKKDTTERHQKEQGAKRARPLPADWSPTKDHERRAKVELRLTDTQWAEAIQEFRDYWRHEAPPGKRKKVDWGRTFSKSLTQYSRINATLRNEPRAAAPPPQSAKSKLDHCFRIFADTGEWRGDQFGWPARPDEPGAEYEPALYAAHGLSDPKQPADLLTLNQRRSV